MPRRVAAAPIVSDNLYKTISINFASYLYATNLLKFDHVVPDKKRSEFYFRDPAKIGPQLLNEFLTTDAKVGAHLLLEARSALLSEIRGGRSRG